MCQNDQISSKHPHQLNPNASNLSKSLPIVPKHPEMSQNGKFRSIIVQTDLFLHKSFEWMMCHLSFKVMAFAFTSFLVLKVKSTIRFEPATQCEKKNAFCLDLVYLKSTWALWISSQILDKSHGIHTPFLWTMSPFYQSLTPFL